MAGRWSQILVGGLLSRGSRLGFWKQEYRDYSDYYDFDYNFVYNDLNSLSL